MRDRIAKLLEVKSIVTIALTAVFCYLAIVGKVDKSDFMTIFTVIVAFYFGTQTMKRGD